MIDAQTARARVTELTEQVEKQRAVVAGIRDMHGDPRRAERHLKLLETELAEAEKRLADLFNTQA